MLACSQDGSCVVAWQLSTGNYIGVAVPPAADPTTAKTLFVDCEEVRPSPFGTIGNYVFLDSNANGIQDTGDTALANVPVNLYQQGGTVPFRTGSTDTLGRYTFAMLPPGTYFVEFPLSLSSGLTLTAMNQGGNGALDSDPDPITGRTGLISLVAEQSYVDADAGYVPYYSVGNRVWLDADNNGIFNSGETALANVKVQVLDGSSNVVDTRFTDAAGNYRFDFLKAGTYTVRLPSDNWTGLAAAGALNGTTPLTGLVSSTGVATAGQTSGPSAVNDIDHGVDAASPQSTGITSPSISLGAGNQPTGEEASPYKSAAFDGATTGVSIPTPTWTGDTFTVAMWVKRNGTQFYPSGLFMDRGATKAAGLAMRASGELTYRWDESEALFNGSGVTVADGVWTLVALTVNGSSGATIYSHDGMLRAYSNPVSHAAHTWNGSINIGYDAYAAERRFKGAIDNVRVWTRALTGTEIGELYFGREPDGLAAKWGLDEASGTLAKDSVGSLNGTYQGSFGLGEMPAPDASYYAGNGPGGDSSDNLAIDFGLSTLPLPDYGDYPAFGSASQTASTEVKIGTAPTDADAANPTTGAATTDDTTGTDDEDLTIPTFQVGTTTSLSVPVTIGGSVATARLIVFVDWNGDGDVVDANETLGVQTVSSSGTKTFSLTPPVGTTPGTKFMRVRISEGSSTPAFSGASLLKGEVEDYAVSVIGSGMVLGNLVFLDNNGDGKYGAGDVGVNGVTVQLFAASDTSYATVLKSATTSGGGFYSFTELSPNDYVVRIPASQFQSGGPLAGKVSSVGAGGNAGGPDYFISDDKDDNADENGVDSHNPALTGIASWPIRLATGTEPTSAGTEVGLGASSDDLADSSGNLTVDFGFVSPAVPACPVNLLYLCGFTKLHDANSFDHGLIGYLAAKGYTITPAVPTASGLKDPMTNAAISSPMNSFTGVLASPTIHGELPYNTGGVATNLAATTANVLMMEGLSSASMGIGTANTVGWDTANGWVENNTVSILPNGLANGNVNIFNPPVTSAGPTGAGKIIVFARGQGAGATIGVWQQDEPSAQGYFAYAYYPPGSQLSNGTTSPGGRVFFGITENGAGYYYPEINVTDPTNFFTAQGKAILDKALVLAFETCSGDYGDYSGFPLASSIAKTTLKIGSIPPDPDDAITATNSTATADDNNGIDDEDTPTQTTLRADQTGTITIRVTNTSGSPAYVNAWVDWNKNGILEASEQISTNSLVATGTSDAALALPVTPSIGTGSGTVYGRFRLTSVMDPGPDGADGDGEVEDHPISITAPNRDYGDFSKFGVASSTRNSSLRIGSMVPDADPGLVPNALASADDDDNLDDEDGITQTTLIPGQTGTITVNVTNTGTGTRYLNAWVDWNDDGTLDTAEKIASARTVGSGTSNANNILSFTVPATAPVGQLGGRFRLNSVSSAPATGQSGSGEVEDHLIVVTLPNLDFGDWNGAGAATASTYSASSRSLRLGATVDVEETVFANANATADDVTGTDDEDGATVPASVSPGGTVTIPVSVTNSSAGTGYLHSWIDFNGDGYFNNATIASGGERLGAAVTVPGLTTGSVFREWWLGIGGASISNLTSNSAYPNNPTGSDMLTRFETPTNWADNLGQRVRGWLIPTVSGTYTFWVAGDDETKLYLSTDSSVANASMIATVPGWSNSREWYKYSQQRSVAIDLVAGQSYYIEAIMKEGGGGDNLAAAWERSGTGTGPVVIDGAY
ncbi:MAG: hypothetical protein KDK97_11720, partial [Verrucomicrobiales bacterium]|nr:hypothetical protein [Verrucomicrobiales bacterium]